jgi:hypothetical protein
LVVLRQSQVTRNGVALDDVMLKFLEAAIEDDADKLSQSFDVYDVCKGDGGMKIFQQKISTFNLPALFILCKKKRIE